MGRSGILLLAGALLGAVAPAEAGPSDPRAAVTAVPAVDDGCVTEASTTWPITRLAGADRYATAACVALAAYPHGVDTVLLARGDDAGGFADALAGTVLARALDAPVLLTGPASLAAPARDAITALQPDRVVVLGGPAAVSDTVLGHARQLAGDATRVAGSTRAGTAAEIAALVPGDRAMVVNGTRPADALAAGAAAARTGAALLLVSSGAVPDETRRSLADRTTVTIVGGFGVVDAEVERSIRALPGTEVTRLGGATRYETAATVARAHPGDGVIHLVSGEDDHLVDAIAAGWLAAMPGGGPVIYTHRDAPNRATDRYLRLGPLAAAPTTRVLGGRASVAEVTVEALEERYAEAAAGGPPDQLRGMWVHLFDDSLKTRAGIEQVLDTASEANLNTVVVQAARRHDAFYASDVLPATTDPDLAPGLDVLGTLIPAAHARGLQVHAWYSLMPSTHPSMQDEDLGADHVNTRHGASSENPWVAAGWTPGYEFLDPALPGVQDHVVDVLTEVVRRYDVDGVHLDYLRYECLQANDNGTCARAEAGDPASANQHPVTMDRWRAHGAGQTLAGFMRSQTEDLVRRIQLEVAAVAPSVVISAALIAQGAGPAGTDLRAGFEQTKAYWNKGQDWPTWLDEGLVDHAYPMAYFRESDATHARWYDDWTRFGASLDTPGIVTAPGQAGFLNCVDASLDQLLEAVTSLDGAVLYSYQHDVSGSCPDAARGDLFRALSAPGGPFVVPARAPEVPHRVRPSTGGVLVEARDGDDVELRSTTGTAADRRRRADATGHAGFVGVEPGTYTVLVENEIVDTLTVTAGEVTVG